MRIIYYLFLLLFISSCNIISKSPKIGFQEGFYTQETDNIEEEVYVQIDEDTLCIYSTTTQNGERVIDISKDCLTYENERDSAFKKITSFSKNTFDIDFLTIPLKYRPSQKGVPAQLNTNLSGALYFGVRTDRYSVSYTANPLNRSDRSINHYGFSFGALTGFGATAMTPTTTNDHISIEYDGIVWIKGLAGIIAVNRFTLGFSAGFDNLLDSNKKYWVYENKPWFGLAFGLNLN